MLHHGVTKYDMVFSHMVFDPRIFRYLHNDTFRFTILREPLKAFVSAFRFFANVPYIKSVSSPDSIYRILTEQDKYKEKGLASLTNNRQSLDLGYNLKYGFNNSTYVKQFIHNTESHFDIVLIKEYFDESLVILKRVLGWSTQDIIYMSKWVANTPTSFTKELKEAYLNVSLADTML